jgi:hypothetical protein
MGYQTLFPFGDGYSTDPKMTRDVSLRQPAFKKQSATFHPPFFLLLLI